MAGTLATVGAFPAQAAFTPSKASAVTIDVDGTTLGIANAAVDLSGTRTGVFGGGLTPASGSSPGVNELTEMYPVKGGAFTNFLARGGVVKKTGGSCGGSGTYYRQAQVTIGNLTSANKNVWLFYDPTIGPNIGAPTPYFNDNLNRISSTANLPKLCDGTTAYASGATGTTATPSAIALGADNLRQTAGLKVRNSTSTTVTFNVYVPLQSGNAGPSENFIGLGILIDYIDGSVVGTTCSAGVASVDTASPNGFASGELAIVDLDTPSTDFDGPRAVGSPSSTTFGGWACTADGVNSGFITRLADSTSDTAVFTHIYAPPWDAMAAQGLTEVALPNCSSPAAGSAPCVDTSATGIFASDGTSSLSGSPSAVVEAIFGSAGPGQTIMNVSMKLGSPSTSGFAIPTLTPVSTMPIAKIKLSLPTTGTHHGVDFGTVNFANSAGNTTLRIDPAAGGLNTWNMTTSGDRRIITVVGQARATSTAVNRQTWQENCSVAISGNTTSTTGCGENLTSSVGATQMVLSSVPVTFALSYSTNPVMQTIAGGMVSTNAQAMKFGDETMAGTSFQFAVAGPSYDASDAPRSNDGFYFVCIPQAFLAGSFTTTPAAAAASWIGTRDGAQTTGVSFSTTTCGTGPGLLASYPEFGYSAPLFRVKPPTAPSSGSSSSSGSTTTSTTTTTTTTTTASTTPTSVPVTPTVAPVVYPNLSVGKSVAPSYLLKLADWTPSKNATVSFSVPKMYRSACMVDDEGRVVAKKAGLCGVRIKVVSPQGKTFYKRVYLTTA